MLLKSLACLVQANSGRFFNNLSFTKSIINTSNLNTNKVRFFHAIKNSLQVTANKTTEITLKPKRRILRNFFLIGVIAPTGSLLIYYQFLNDKES